MDYRAVLREGITEIFQTMVMMTVFPHGRVTDIGSASLQSVITGMIGLSGDIKGMLAIHASAEVALAVTGAMLDMKIAEIGDDAKDTFGEITNVLAGHLKTVCAEHSVNIQLAIPSSVVGRSFHLGGFKGAHHVVESFYLDAGILLVELKFVTA